MSDTGGRIENYEDFVKVHGLLFSVSGLSRSLHRKLFNKLISETFDGGAYFQVEPCEEGRQRRLVLTSDSMPNESNVFLVDHAWTFRLYNAYKQLQEVPGLAQRMASLMCVDIDLNSNAEDEDGGSQENKSKLNAIDVVENEINDAKAEGCDTVRWLELEELDIDDDMLLSLDLRSKFPLEDATISSWYSFNLETGNKLENVETVVQEVTKFKNPRALWLNNNPFLKNCDDHMMDTIIQGCPKLEIYNSRFTNNFGEWALGFCGEVYEKDNPGCINERDSQLQGVISLDISNRCVHSLINKAFSPVKMSSLSPFNIQGNPLEQNSFNELLEVLKGFPCLQSLEVDIPGPLGDSAIEIVRSLPSLSLLNGVYASKILETGKHVIDSILQPCLPKWTAYEPLPDRVINAM